MALQGRWPVNQGTADCSSSKHAHVFLIHPCSIYTPEAERLEEEGASDSSKSAPVM